jgi:hypothetical protein
MRKIEPDQIELAALYSQCVAQKQDALLRARLTIAMPVVTAGAAQYEARGTATSLHGFQSEEMPSGGATTDDLVNLYETTLARQGASGRWAYDRIMLSAPGGRCPYCGQLPVNVLDHYLPKRPNGVLALVPKNLVPCCRDCNTAKLDRVAWNEASQPIHPYFDDFDDAQWLQALVLEQGGIILEYFVADVPQWSAMKQARAQHHFKLFKLSKLFSTEAATELVNIKHRLIKLHAERGPDAVQHHLCEEADARAAAFVNSWQTAMYRALATNRAFCEAGFHAVGL